VYAIETETIKDVLSAANSSWYPIAVFAGVLWTRVKITLTISDSGWLLAEDF
jgi:hypothetical protein